jgi:putative radical SAM enzyme (TIGR03279 family)
LLALTNRASIARRSATSGLVVAVEPESPAERADLRAGDRLLAVNGLVPRDIIDVRLDASTDHVELDVVRGDDRFVLTVDKDPDEDLGIAFESPAFDGMKRCNNACEFCFIRGLPAGLRRSLYIKDDDFRYSFLYGNFTTLTNLSEAEWRRLLFQRLSPLRVSVHATDPDLRRDLLENTTAPPILPQLDELGRHGIRVHAQIVLMPGRNDGAALEQTISDLAERYPTVESAAVVPVGLTVHSRVTKTRPMTPGDAAAAVALVERRQREYRRALGSGFVYAGDELYLLADRRLPGPRSYDDYPQLQNGVGLVQLFNQAWRQAARRLPARVDLPMRVCWATAPLMASVLRNCAADLASIEGLRITVVAIENSLFGDQVSVAGLVSGRDVVATLRDQSCDRVVLPRTMFDTAGRQTIDGWTPQEIADALGVQVAVGGGPKDLIEATAQRVPNTVNLVYPNRGEAVPCAES